MLFTHVSLRFVCFSPVNLFFYRLDQEEQRVSKSLKQHDTKEHKVSSRHSVQWMLKVNVLELDFPSHYFFFAFLLLESSFSTNRTKNQTNKQRLCTNRCCFCAQWKTNSLNILWPFFAQKGEMEDDIDLSCRNTVYDTFSLVLSNRYV